MVSNLNPPIRPAVLRPTLRFMLSHPAHWIALGFGSGLPRIAPGTVGTLWAWGVYWVLRPGLDDLQWAGVTLAAFAIGWWATSATSSRPAERAPRWMPMPPCN